jgi:hypothetical protein
MPRNGEPQNSQGTRLGPAPPFSFALFLQCHKWAWTWINTDVFLCGPSCLKTSFTLTSVVGKIGVFWIRSNARQAPKCYPSLESLFVMLQLPHLCLRGKNPPKQTPGRLREDSGKTPLTQLRFAYTVGWQDEVQASLVPWSMTALGLIASFDLYKDLWRQTLGVFLYSPRCLLCTGQQINTCSMSKWIHEQMNHKEGKTRILCPSCMRKARLRLTQGPTATN